MALSEGDKAIVTNIAAEFVKEVVPAMIEAHMSSCPTGEKLTFAKGAMWMLGAILASSAFSTVIALLVAHMSKG